MAEKLQTEPLRVLEVGWRNVKKMRERAFAVSAEPWLDEWEQRLCAGPEAVADILVDPSEHGHDMRQMMPFAGVLSNQERWSVMKNAYRAGAHE